MANKLIETIKDVVVETTKEKWKNNPDAIPIGPNWPKQTLFCGHLVGVEWGGSGGYYDSDDELDLSEIDVAIGRTQPEAMASLISTKQGGPNRKNLEEALTAIGLGVLDSIDEPDGDMLLDHAVHRQSFMAKAGEQIAGTKISPTGYRVKKLTDNQGERIPQTGYPLQIESGTCKIEVNQTLIISGVSYNVDEINQAAPGFTSSEGESVTEITLTPGLPADTEFEDEATIKILEPIDFAGPNFYEPKELNLVVSNVKRSTRYGEDGIYDEDGMLLCRVSLGSTPFDSYPGPWSSYKIEDLPYHASIPNEVRFLNQTCFYFGLAHYSNQNYGEFLKDYADGYTIAIEPDDWIKFESFALGQKQASEFYLNPCVKYLRSPLAINTWRQAWVPIFMDYTIELHPLANLDWLLGDIDFNLVDVNNIQNSLSNNPEIFIGRSFLYGKSGVAFAQQIDHLKDKLDKRNVNPEVDPKVDTTKLENLKNNMAALDVLATSIPHEDLQLSELSASLLDSAIGDLVKVTIIDIFGQVISLEKGSSTADLTPSVALSLETINDDRYVLLRPRFSSHTRLNLTMVSMQDDQTRSDPSPSLTPIAGFLLPDHLEWALEAFDSSGGPLGQLRVAERNWVLDGYQAGRITWDPCPGSEVELGTPPETGNNHLDLILNELIKISLEDEISRQEKERLDLPLTSNEEGVLSALMRGVDTTLHNTDPQGKTAEDFPSLFAGRPIAVVRAELTLEMETDDFALLNQEELKEQFEVKLGSLERTVDGLLGYFLDDDYSTFHTVLPSGQSQFSNSDILHPYLNFDPTIDIRVGQLIKLTLLIDPQASVHVTCGFLPQKEMTLLKEHKDEALARLAPTFSFGPLLVEPGNVRLPMPDLIQPVKWSWISHPSISEWDEVPIMQEDGKPNIPNGRIRAWNGWIKLDLDESQEN